MFRDYDSTPIHRQRRFHRFRPYVVVTGDQLAIFPLTLEDFFHTTTGTCRRSDALEDRLRSLPSTVLES